MSGPKMSAYEVQRNRELEGIARGHARERLGVLDREMEDLKEEASRGGHLAASDFTSLSFPASVSDSADLGSLISYENRLRESVQQFRRALRLSALRHETSILFRDALAERRRIPLVQAPSTAVVSQSAEPDLAGPKIAERVERLLSALPPEIGEDAKRRVLDIAAELTARPNSERTRPLLAALNAELQEALDRERTIRASRAEASGLLQELDGLEGPAIADLRTNLADAISTGTGVPQEIKARVLGAREAGRRSADRAYVASVLKTAFGGLGYKVATGFDTLVVEDGVAFCTRPETPEYAVRVRLSQDKPTLDVDVVRTAQTQGRTQQEQTVRDGEVERDFCPLYDKLIAEVARHDVICRTVRRLAPGERPVPLVIDKSAEGRHSSQTQEMRPMFRERRMDEE